MANKTSEKTEETKTRAKVISDVSRKIFSFLMAMVLLLSVSVPVFAWQAERELSLEYYSFWESDWTEGNYFHVADEIITAESTDTGETDEQNPDMGMIAPITILDYSVYATEEEAKAAQLAEIKDGSEFMPMSARSITIVNITSTSVTLNLVFPVSGARGNILRIGNFNRGELLWTTHQDNWNRTNGNVTINNLTPGGLYHFALMWSTNGGATSGGHNSIFRRVLPPHNTPENLIRTTSGRGRIISYTEAADRSLATAANYTLWLSRMESVYDALANLTGHTPFPQMTMRSARYSLWAPWLPDGQNTWFEVGGWSGNPIGLYRPFHRSFMMRLSNNDWGETAIHEMSHNFGSRRWEFDIEFFAYLKTLYVMETLNARIHRIDMQQWFTGSQYANFFRNHALWGYNTAGFNAQNDMNFSLGLSHIFTNIRNQIGWEPFRRTFRHFNALHTSHVPATNIARFNMFVTMLGHFSNRDVFAMISQGNRAIIQQRFGGTIGPVNPPQPTITTPAANSPPVPLQNLSVTWNAVPNATHNITLRNLATNATPISNQSVTGNNFTINQSHLAAGNQFRITVSATIGTRTSSFNRDFSVTSATLSVNPTSWTAAGAGQATTFTITTNQPIGNVIVSSNQNWLTISGAGAARTLRADEKSVC